MKPEGDLERERETVVTLSCSEAEVYGIVEYNTVQYMRLYGIIRNLTSVQAYCT